MCRSDLVTTHRLFHSSARIQDCIRDAALRQLDASGCNRRCARTTGACFGRWSAFAVPAVAEKNGSFLRLAMS